MKKDRKRRAAAAVDGLAHVPRRHPGRPAGRGSVSLPSILETSYKLAETVPLQDLSIIVVAKSLKVTPALIHYYVGGRDWLTSGIMNRFYAELLEKMPDRTGDWRRDIPKTARAIYDHLVNYAGITSYVVSHSQFRTFQLTAPGQTDYGVEVLERLAACVLQAGCSNKRTGIYTHLISEFVISSAYSTLRHLFPSDHQKFLQGKLASLDPERFPTLMMTDSAPMSLGPETAFNEGIELFMLGFERDRRTATEKPPASAAL